MLRLIVALCYGAAILITLLTFVGIFVVERGQGAILAGWGFWTALLFAIGRLADLARGERH